LDSYIYLNYAFVSLAKLRDDGIISSEEFDAKKAELLSRL
jgi:Short C-terminal domain